MLFFCLTKTFGGIELPLEVKEKQEQRNKE